MSASAAVPAAVADQIVEKLSGPEIHALLRRFGNIPCSDADDRFAIGPQLFFLLVQPER